ncbi:MAG TPA: substrate-binding domain-containing protein [Streptosporangiaceae bacterium]|jgi:DNA-binding LacI/PurR family transcriptional regulator|nr:substrate-binding domain-containing protein [Streptosporangiaceae bacterium]
MPAATGARPPVMADVAKLAGVSAQTVSRVLNDRPNVSDRARDAVLAAIAQLGYRPNAAARTLVTRRTRTLGVISFDTTLYGPASMLHGIERAAAGHYFVSIVSLPALDRPSVIGAVERLLEQGVDGIIVIAPMKPVVDACGAIDHGVPLVAVGCGTNAPLASVAVDNTAGAALATRFLLGHGHATVHHVAGPRTWLDAQERIAGWRAALRDAAAPVPELVVGDWSSAAGYRIGQAIAADPQVTAVLCGNDHMALGLLRALTEQGRRIPADISVVGFDDIPESGYFLPPLTTVRQDFGALGRHALGVLVALIDGQPAPEVCLRIPPQLVDRASAGPPPR